MTVERPRYPADFDYVYWEKCEQIAMHFNELLINFRTKAIGTLTLVGGAAGVAVKLAALEGQGLMILGYVSSALAILWSGVFFLDSLYYEALLRGAVDEIIRVENLSNGRVQLSKKIERAVRGERSDKHVPFGWGKRAFYGLPYGLLGIPGVILLAEGGAQKSALAAAIVLVFILGAARKALHSRGKRGHSTQEGT